MSTHYKVKFADFAFEEKVKEVAEQLESRKDIKVLSFEPAQSEDDQGYLRRGLHPSIYSAISKLLASSTTLEQLDLTEALGDIGEPIEFMELLIKGLSQNKTLKVLNLSGNGISGHESIVGLAKAVPNSLQTLNLSDCPLISEKALTDLLEILAVSHPLLKVYFTVPSDPSRKKMIKYIWYSSFIGICCLLPILIMLAFAREDYFQGAPSVRNSYSKGLCFTESSSVVYRNNSNECSIKSRVIFSVLIYEFNNNITYVALGGPYGEDGKKGKLSDHLIQSNFTCWYHSKPLTIERFNKDFCEISYWDSYPVYDNFNSSSVGSFWGLVSASFICFIACSANLIIAIVFYLRISTRVKQERDFLKRKAVTHNTTLTIEEDPNVVELEN